MALVSYIGRISEKESHIELWVAASDVQNGYRWVIVAESVRKDLAFEGIPELQFIRLDLLNGPLLVSSVG